MIDLKQKYQSQVNNFKKWFVFYSLAISLYSGTVGGICGYVIGKENAQKIADKKMVQKRQQPQKTIGE